MRKSAGPSAKDYARFFEHLAEVLKPFRRSDQFEPSQMRPALEAVINSRPVGLLPGEHASRLDVLASNSLSGGRYPCASIDCRVKNASSGARFAALYADHVWIRDPFEGVVHHQADDVSYVERAIGSIAVMMEWKPLLVSGIASHLAPLCTKCATAHVNEQHLLESPLTELIDALADQFEATAEAIVHRGDEAGEIDLEYVLPTRYTGHRAVHYSLRGSSAKRFTRFLGKRASRKMSRKDATRLNAFSHVYAPIVDEALIHAIHRDVTGGTYASNLPIDLEIASRSNSSDVQHASRLLRAVTHTVPVLENIPLSVVLRIRAEDDGSFQLYRNRVAAIRHQVKDEKGLREAAEQLRTDYAGLEARITSRRKSSWGRLRDQVTIATGTIGAGVSTWISGLLSPTWSAVVAAAGGVPSLQKLVADTLAARRLDASEMQHSLYFLWKLKNAKKRKL